MNGPESESAPLDYVNLHESLVNEFALSTLFDYKKTVYSLKILCLSFTLPVIIGLTESSNYQKCTLNYNKALMV